LVLNQPKKLKSALKTAPVLPEDSTDDFHFFHPETDSRIDMNGESELSSSRQALLLLALLTDNPNSGPEQLLRVLHQKPNIVGKNKGKNRNKDNFLDYLVDKTVQLDQMQSNADIQSSKNKEELNDKEIVSKIGDTTAQNIVSFAKIRRSNLENSDSQTKKILQDAETNMKQNRQILGQQRYVVPTEDKEIEKNQKSKNNELSESLRKQLQILRSKDEISDQNSEDIIFALLQLQKGKFPTSKKEISNNLNELLKKEISELTHEEIAVTLSFEMEILTRVNDEKEKINSLEEKVLLLAEKIHKLGFYFINAKLRNVLDPLMLHMSGVNFCLVHTPPQLQMLANLSTSMQSIATSLPVVQVLPSISSGIPFGSGVSFFAQAINFGGASLGAAFSLGGERSPGVNVAGSTLKPKKTKILREKSKKKVIFQSQGGGGSSNKSESRGKQKAIILPVAPKPKERIVKVPTAKKTKKPKSTPVPSRQKKREVSIFTARRTPKSKVSLPIPKKPKVEHTPQPRIKNRSRNERKTHISNSEQQLQIESATTSTSFNKKLDQTFKKKHKQELTTKTKVAFSQSQVTSTPRQQTESSRKHNQFKKATKNDQTQSKSEVKKKAVRATSRQRTQSNPAKEARSVKETKKAPAISSKNKTTENKTKSEQIKLTKTKKNSKVNIGKTDKKMEIRQVVKKKKVKEVRVTQEQSTTARLVETPTKTIEENLTTLTTALVGGALFKTAKNIIPSQDLEVNKLTTDTIEATENSSTQGTKLDEIITPNARKHAEYGRGHGDGSSKMKAKNKVSAKKTDKVLTATMRSLPTNAMVDVSDSFNTAREVKMWAYEALAHPKLMERYYATAA